MCTFKRFEKIEIYKQTKKKLYFITKILILTKLPNPIRETRVLKLVFRTIPCLKFWDQSIQSFKVGESILSTIYNIFIYIFKEEENGQGSKLITSFFPSKARTILTLSQLGGGVK